MGAPTLAELDVIAAPILSADKSLNLGPFIIAMGLDAVLAGILFMQCGAYKSLAPQDPNWIRYMVLYVLLMNVAITMYTWAWIYDLFVFNFGNYGLFLSVKYLSWFYVLDSATVIVVQGFFAIRAWRLVNKSYPVLLIIGAFALTAFGGGIAVKVMFTGFGSTLRAGDVKVPAYIWLFCTVVADLTITIIILFFIVKNRTGWSGTDNILTRLARMTFESQLPPTLIAIGLAIEYTIKYDSFVAIPFICVQAKFYGISLVHTLNGRVHLKRGNTSGGENSSAQHSSKISRTQQKNTNPYYLNASRKENTTIQVETTFDVVQDIGRPLEVQVAATSRSGQSKRTSDDGLSFNSSNYKVPQDEEAKPGEYKLQDLGARENSTHPNPAAPW
ncbi:transmembrane protein, putative, partial [Rhizoctonia solani AG-3 Rhs1AP]